MKIEVLRSNELNTGHLTTSCRNNKIKRGRYIKTIFLIRFFGGKFFLKFIEYKKNIFIPIFTAAINLLQGDHVGLTK
jgi:hypothetical protein